MIVDKKHWKITWYLKVHYRWKCKICRIYTCISCNFLISTTFDRTYISFLNSTIFWKIEKNIFYQNGTFLSFVIFLTCRGDFWKKNLSKVIGITKCDLTFCWEFSYFLTCKVLRVDFLWKINSYYKVCFYKKSQKEGINVKNDQKVIKNRLLKTGVSFVIRPFVSIL